MRVLVVCDDYYHPARTPRSGLAPLEGNDFAFDWIENAADWSAERMAGYPVVLLAKGGNVSSTDRTPWVTDEVQQAFADYVRKGNGLLVVHSGSADLDGKPVLRALIGGAFITHPHQCPVTMEPRPGHRLTVGSAPFTLVDEHYFMALDDARADLFMTTTSEHGTRAGGWTRTEGAGRVCVLSPGHNVPIWLHPSFQALLRNALQWCGTPTPAEAHT